jgi:hypothetical protein
MGRCNQADLTGIGLKADTAVARVPMRVTIEIDGQEHTMDLPDETVRYLEAIAARNNLSFLTALQQAIFNENFLEDQQANGAKLLIVKDDKLRELVREPARESEPA